MSSQATKHNPPPFVAIFILSASALAYEVLLVRLFSIVHWHHFSFMVISIALLGYGVSGSLITVFREKLLDHYDSVFILNALLFGISSITCFIVVQQLHFNTLEILWDSSQWLRLLVSYLLLTLPFFFIANAIALTLMRFHQSLSLIYGIDLIGAGAGAMLIMVLFQFYSPETTLRIIAITGTAAAFFTLPVSNHKLKRMVLTIILFIIFTIFIMPQQWVKLRLSEYKGLPQTLLIKETALESTHSSPVSRIDVVSSPYIPFRHAPGLSLQSPAAPPEQLAVFKDGDEMSVIDLAKNRTSLEYYDYMTSALPYHIHGKPENALILSSSTGSQILQAQFFNIPVIDAVEPDRQLSQLITEQYSDHYGWKNLDKKVRINNISSRGYAASDKKYDLIIMGPSGASAGSSAGVHTLSTSYDYTVEALRDYLKLLEADGLLSITMWTSTPARANLKLFATAITAMKNAGIEQPENNISWIRSWNTATLVIKKNKLTEEEIESTRYFSSSRNFDLAWIPGIKQSETNKYQLLQEPVFYHTAHSLLTGKDNFISEYKYNIHPATDNKPYFNNFFRWTSFNEFLSLPGTTGVSMIGVGYPTLLVTFLQATIAAFTLILTPLLFVKSRKSGEKNRRRNIVTYFMAIGLAFLFIEIAFIQKFTLILSQPLYAVAVALCAFLVFSGVGSLYVQQRIKNSSIETLPGLLRLSVIMIGVISIVYILLLPRIGSTIMAWPEVARIISAFIIAAPLAFAMGMPFPIGMASLQQSRPDLVPWAWGINGCASVLSAVLAVLLAIEIGFNGVMLCAVLLYFLAWANTPKTT